MTLDILSSSKGEMIEQFVELKENLRISQGS